MFLADNIGIENTRRRIERVNGGIDTQFRNLTAQHRGCVQVGKGRGGRGVGQVVGRHVNGLNGGNRTVLRRRDALLHRTHFAGQRRLIAHGGRHTAEQCRHFGTGLSETEDIIDEEEDICCLTLGCACIAERLGNAQARKGHAGTRSGRLVHLTVNKRGLTLGYFFVIHLGEVPFAALHSLGEFLAVAHYAALNHLAQQVVTLAGALTHAGEYGEAVVPLGNIVDQLHNEHRLAHAGAAEQSDFTALGIRFEQVDNLDARIQHLATGFEVFKLRRFAMDRRHALAAVGGFETVDDVAGHVEHTSLNLVARRHGDRRSEARGFQASAKAVGIVHGNGSHGVLADVLLHFEDNFASVGVDHFKGFVDGGQALLGILSVCFKANVYNGADDL